jgi:hypothetical protein
MRIGNRGLSPLIASVFLIVLALVISSLVYSWSYGFIRGKADVNGLSIIELCDAVDFSVVVVSNLSGTYDLEIVNRGNINISSLKFKAYSGGDSKVVDSNMSILVGGAVTGSVDLGVVDQVGVLPVLDGKLVGEDSDIVCEKNPVFLELI